MRSYWNCYRKPFTFVKVMSQYQSLHHEQLHDEHTSHEEKIKKAIMGFYFSKTFLAEVLILIVMPWPFTDLIYIKWTQPNWLVDPGQKITIHYRLSDFLMALMFMRLVFLVNLYKHLAPWRTLQGFRTLTENKMHAHFLLHLRDGLKHHPRFDFTFIFLVAVFTLAYIIRIFERPYYYAYLYSGGLPTPDQYPNIYEAVWLTIITMTTVGYGDVVAVTTFGRITSILTAMLGTVMISLLVATMSTQL